MWLSSRDLAQNALDSGFYPYTTEKKKKLTLSKRSQAYKIRKPTYMDFPEKANL